MIMQKSLQIMSLVNCAERVLHGMSNSRLAGSQSGTIMAESNVSPFVDALPGNYEEPPVKKLLDSKLLSKWPEAEYSCRCLWNSI
jgi:hypothetical protein